jgi:hypothetical protein
VQIDNAARLESVDSCFDGFFTHALAEETADYADVTDRKFGGAYFRRLFVGEIIGRFIRSLPLSPP